MLNPKPPNTRQPSGKSAQAGAGDSIHQHDHWMGNRTTPNPSETPLPLVTRAPSCSSNAKNMTTSSLSHHLFTDGSAPTTNYVPSLFHDPNMIMNNSMAQQTAMAAQMHLHAMALSMGGFLPHAHMASPFAFPFVNVATFMGPFSVPCYSMHPAFIPYANMSLPVPAAYYVNSNFTRLAKHNNNNTRPNWHHQQEYFPADNLPESEFPNGINCSKQEVAKDWIKREFGTGFSQINCRSYTNDDRCALRRACYRCKVPGCPFRFRLEQIEQDADKYRIMYKSNGVSGFKPTHSDHPISHPQHRPVNRPATNKKRKKSES